MWGFVDWGSQEHQLCIVDADGELICQRRFSQTAASLAELCTLLRQPRPGLPPVQAVGIERRDGLLVDAMLEAGLAVHVINPRQLEQFRKFVAPSGRKDDRLDAYVGAEAIRQHPRRFTRLSTPEPWTIVLRDQLCLRDDLVQRQVRLLQKSREQLLRYYPQFWELGSLKTIWQRALWRRVSTPAKARRVRPKTIAKLLREHQVRRYDADGLLEVLKQTPMTVADGVVEGASCRLRCYLAELDIVQEQIARCEREADRMLQQRNASERESLAPDQPTDIELASQMPGFGDLTVATLFAYASTAILARDLQHLRAYAGVAPVSVLTGKTQNRYHKRAKLKVRMRMACSDALRHALHMAAHNAARYSDFYKARYQRYRLAGHSHGRACRQISDHQLRVMIATLRSRVPFDANRLDEEQA